MFYLIEQYIWFLVAAFTVGTLVGWWSSATLRDDEASNTPTRKD